MDAKCLLRIIGQGFGEDGYGIGLPKGSHLKVSAFRATFPTPIRALNDPLINQCAPLLSQSMS